MTTGMVNGLTDLPQVLLALVMLVRSRTLPATPLTTTWIAIWLTSGIGHAVGATLHIAAPSLAREVVILSGVVILAVTTAGFWLTFRFSMLLVGWRAGWPVHGAVLASILLSVSMAFFRWDWSLIALNLWIGALMVVLAWRTEAGCTQKERLALTMSGAVLLAAWALYLLRIGVSDIVEHTALYHVGVGISLALFAWVESRVRRAGGAVPASPEPAVARQP